MYVNEGERIMTKNEVLKYISEYKSLKGIEDELAKFNDDDLTNIYEEVLKYDCHWIRQVPENILIKNSSMMIKAVKQDLKLLKYMPKSALENHPSICLKAVNRYPELLKYVPDNIKIMKPEICIEAVYRWPDLMKYVPDIVKTKHPKFCFNTLEKYKYVIEYIPVEVLKRNPDFVYNLLRENKYNTTYNVGKFNIPQELNEICQKNCIELAHENIIACFNMLTNDTKKENIDLCILAAKTGEFGLKDFPETMLMENLEICIELARTGRFKPEDFSKILPEVNNEIYREIAKTGKFRLKDFPKTILTENLEICIELARTGRFGPEDFFEILPEVNNEIYIEIAKTGNFGKRDFPEEILEENPEIYKMILEGKRAELEEIPYEIQERYPEECLKVVRDSEGKFYGEYVYNFCSISPKILIDHPEICVEAIKNWDYNLNKISYGEKEIEDNYQIYEVIPKELLDNPEFVKNVLDIDKNVILYCNSEIRNELINHKDEKIGPEWQQECLEKIKDSNNVILSSPTGSGKTNVFLQWALQKEQRPIYITAPIKALSNQRFRELQEQGYTVGLETGDIKNVSENCDFICCTQEIYTNKYAEQENATLIVDEFHYIFENPYRARTYIDALHNSKAQNILLCSATMGKIDELNEYIENVSNREFTTYEGKSRLTPLEYNGNISIKDIKNSLVITFSKGNIECALYDLYNQREPLSEDKLAEIKELSEKYGIDYKKIEDNYLLRYMEYGIAGYYGGLLPKEKLFIEECFEKRAIDTVVGTDALAMGVNFPVENVVFTQLAKYHDGPISKNLFDQIAGRAGRKGYFDKGNVYICDEFENDRGYPFEARNYDTKSLYTAFIFAENENVSIYLQPHIKDILQGKTTIEEEAEFISRFSTGKPDLDLTIQDIERKIDIIIDADNFKNIVEDMLDDEFGYDDEEYDDYNDEYEDVHIFESDSEEVRKRREKLLMLQDKFYKNIGSAYFDEYEPEKNCKIFIDILDGKDITELQEKYTNSFADLLQFRKYIKSLPKQYRQNFKISELDNKINEIDETALNYGRGNITTKIIDKNTQNEQLDLNAMKNALNVMKIQNESNQEKTGGISHE